MTLGTHRDRAPSARSASPVVSHGIEVFDLAAEAGSIASAHDPARTARTLAMFDTLRLTLMRLKAGAKVKQHHTDHHLSIHTVSGHVSIHTPERHFELPAGHVAVLERGLVHDVQASVDSAVLVTVSMWREQDRRPPDSDDPPAED